MGVAECMTCRQFERIVALTRVVPPYDSAESKVISLATPPTVLSDVSQKWGPYPQGSIIRLVNGAAGIYWLAGKGMGNPNLGLGTASIPLGPWQWVDVECSQSDTYIHAVTAEVDSEDAPLPTVVCVFTTDILRMRPFPPNGA